MAETKKISKKKIKEKKTRILMLIGAFAPIVIGIILAVFVLGKKNYLYVSFAYDKNSYIIPEGTINYSHDYNIEIEFSNNVFSGEEYINPSSINYKKYFTITPKIKYKIKLKSRSSIIIKPDISSLKNNFKFTIKINKDLESIKGVPLKDNYSLNVYYRKFRILAKNIMPDQKLETLNKDIFLFFNYPVNIQNLKNNLLIRNKQSSKILDNIVIEKINFAYKSAYEINEVIKQLNFDSNLPSDYINYIKANYRRYHLYLVRVYNLKVETQYSLNLKKEMKISFGNAAFENGLKIDFHTFDRFKVMFDNTYVYKVNPETPIKIRLNNDFTFNEQILKRTFKIINAKTKKTVNITKVETYQYYHYSGYSYTSSGTTSNYKKGLKIYFNSKVGQKYVLIVKDNLRDKYKQKILPTEIKVKVNDYPPYLSTPLPQKGIFESEGKIFKFPMAYINLEGIKVKIKTYHNAKSHLEKNPSVTKEILIKKKEIKRNIRQKKFIDLKKFLNRNHGFVKIELEAASLDGEYHGRQQGYNSNDRSYREFFYQFTNMSITTKYSPKNIFIYVSHLTNPEPVKNARVTLYSKNGSDYDKIITKYTNYKGYIIIPNTHPAFEKLYARMKRGFQHQNYYVDTDSSTNTEPDFLIIAEKGRDFCELNFNNNTTIDLSNTSVDNTANAMSSFYAFVFTPKGIYKQKETVLIKGYARENKNGKIVASKNQEYTLTVVSPDNSTVLEKTVKTNRFGAFSVKYKLSDSPELGKYVISLKRDISSNHISYENKVFNGSFMVEAYRTRRFEVSVKVGRGKRRYYKGDRVPFFVTAKYLHGGLMRNAKIKYRIDAYPFDFKNFKFSLQKYRFSSGKWIEHGSNEETTISETSLTVQDVKIGKLDAAGRFYGSFIAKVPFNNSCVYKVVVEVEDQDRQSIVSTATKLVHKSRYYIGYSLNKFFLKTNNNLNIKLVSAKPDGKPAGRRSVTLRFYKVEWSNVRKLSSSGYYKWHSTKKFKLVKIINTRTTGNHRNPKNVYFKPTAPGTYYVTFESKDRIGTRIKNLAKFWVHGDQYTAWKMSDNQSIDLIRDKSFYKVGDYANIMVKSPYKNVKALVTIEREGVIDSFTTTIKNTAGIVKVPIKKNYAPNAFVSIMLLQGRVNNQYPITKLRDIYKPTVKVGYTVLYVKRNRKKLNIKITKLRKTYKPRSKVNMRIKISDYSRTGLRTEVGVYVVDEGVLSLIGYKTPNPFYAFHRNKELMVKTADNRLEVVGQHKYTLKGENPGGSGKGDYDIRSSLGISNVAARKLFKAIAYSNPSITTDSQGYANISFTLPDNLTKYRVMVVAADATDKFGAAHTYIRVSRPLIARPALPRFLNLNDRVNAGVVVMNNQNRAVYATVSVGTKNIKRIGIKTKKVYLPANGAKEVRFNFIANKLGKAQFKFGVAAKAGGKRLVDVVEWKIPVNMPFYQRYVAIAGSTTRSLVTHNLPIPKFARREQIGVEVTTSSTALSKIKGSVEYLFGYPYGCLEQRMTKVMPMLLAGDLVKQFKLQVNVPFKQLVQKYISDFYRYQTSSGGFSIWPEPQYQYSTKPYLTGYVLYIMHIGEKLGYKVDSDVRKRTLMYLKKYLSGERITMVSDYGRSYRIASNIFIFYILSEFGEARESYADSLIRAMDNQSLYVKSILAKALFNINRNKYKGVINKIANEIKSKISYSGNDKAFISTNYKQYSYYRDLYMSDVKTTSSAILALLKIDKNNKNITKLVKGLLSKMKNGQYRTTQQNMYVLWALLSYFKIFEKHVPNFKAVIYAEIKKILTVYYKGRNFNVATGSTKFINYNRDKVRVKINKSGKGRLYYTVRFHYVPEKLPDEINNGFSVEKIIYDVQTNERVTSGKFKAGRTYRVKLKITATETRHSVVIDDPLAAGFEALNPRLNRSSIDVNDNNNNNAWMNGFNRVAMKDDRVCLFADKLKKGVYTYTYNMKATSIGNFIMFPTKAEEMYNPDINGFSSSGRITIR